MPVATRSKRRRLSREERSEMERESLSRARSSFSMANFVPVIQEFAARGIPLAEICPKENVFTYHAWRALGRQVRKGEHGVKVSVCFKRDDDKQQAADGKPATRTIFASAVVFHVSQTDPIGDTERMGS